MKSKTSIVLSTVQNVQVFMTNNASALGTLNSSDSRKALDDVEAALSSHAITQTRSSSGKKAAIARLSVLKSALLVKYLRPISAIADAQLSQSPDFVEMKLPKTLNTTPQLLAAAAAMAGAAANHEATFVGAGLAPTFIADLQAAANEVKIGASTKSSKVGSQVGATSALDAASKQAHKIVKQLDALIEPLLANNTALLTEWKSTKRFQGRTPAIASVTVSSSGNATGAGTTASDTAEATQPVGAQQPVAAQPVAAQPVAAQPPVASSQPTA